jgi:hypothetical protein
MTTVSIFHSRVFVPNPLEVNDRGYLDTNEAGNITAQSRLKLHRVKQELFAKRTLIEAGGWVWRI